MRFTPDHIKELNPNEVFVFGSNLGGRHGAGAAKTALKSFGAKYGQAEGLQGQSYALPTVNATITNTLSLAKIANHVETFIAFAKENTTLTFYVTEVGCGLAGLTIREVAPLFKDALNTPNIILPMRFFNVIQG